MARRRQEDPPAGSPAWMATFSDLMNLLLCFFVLLFSMSTVDEEKYNQLLASISSAFSILDGGASSIGDGMLVSNGVSQLNELDEYINSTGNTADSTVDSEDYNDFEHGDELTDAEKFEQMLEEIEQHNLTANEQLAEIIDEAVEEAGLAEKIDVSFTAQYVELSLKGALLFDSGKAELKDSSMPVMSRVAVILERYAGSTIEIEGHTDTKPISNAEFANNNELSSARALNVFDYLVDNTSLDPADIKHSGRGEYVPIADNTTEEGRAKNRRVEIRIYNPIIR
jgi:chemotaxis protein MotB